MQRALSKIFKSRLTHHNCYLSSVDASKKPSKFFTHVYGITTRFNVFGTLALELNDDKYKFYQRNSPNYVVALVKKFQENRDNRDNTSGEGKDVHDEFHKECSYCKIIYEAKNQVYLTKICKVKVEEIKKMEIPDFKEEEGKQSNKEDLVQNPQIIIQPINPKPNKQNQKLRNENTGVPEMDSSEVYELVVKKIEEPLCQINENIEFKFLYLISMFTISQINIQLNYSPQKLDFIAQFLCNQVALSTMQKYLEENDVQKKIDILITAQSNILMTNEQYNSIKQITKSTFRNKKVYQYYMELFKVSKDKAHGKKSRELFVDRVTASFNAMNPPPHVQEIFDREIEKFNGVDEFSQEAGVIKPYIEELSKIPYDVKSEERFDIEYAQQVLDEDHYGMKEVKDAILEIIAVGKLKKNLKGKIFCFIGGPGLGKTSFAKSVAKALNRKFFNISLGGVNDSSVLKGHRRTYIGAYSGKIIEALKTCGTSNPVILLDEIDKMGNSYHGDPRSELLQILDPNQNNSFLDNYVDVPVDLSNVLFITSANYEKLISKPLLDRMEKIYLTSYTQAEKVEIFNRHLLQRAIDQTGVKPGNFTLPQEVIEQMVEQYSLGEPGVRYLEKCAFKMLEKAAFKMMMKEDQPIQITKENLSEFLGKSYLRKKDHTKNNVGVAISLGGGSYASRLTYIESFRKNYVNRKQINRGAVFTGSLGDVFKEAMNISYTYARNLLLDKFSNKYLYENQVHVHAPEGASKKDGSADSLTIVASLVSLAISEKVRPGLAMTGEITLHGLVLRSHSIKQKVILAKRERITELILPKLNEGDVENLSKDLKQDIKFHYVNHFEETLPLLFPNFDFQKLGAKKAESLA